MIGRRPYPFDVIARVLAERLRGRAPSEELRAVVRAHGIDWEGVVGHASADLVLPALAAALSDLGLSESLDPELGAFLDAVHAANTERNNELRDELSGVVDILNRVGIEPILLKGAIRLLDGLYPDHGWRMLRDLDLLVPQASLMTATQALMNAGYARCGAGGEVRRPGGACQIDIHTELFFTQRHVRLLQAAELLGEARCVAFGAGRVHVPTIEHQLVHLIAHSQIRHLGHACGHVSLCDRLEAAALIHWGRVTFDWSVVAAHFAAAGYQRPLLSFLLALSDGDWCAVQADKIGPLAALQQRRIGLQARSTTFAYIGSRVGWWLSALATQLEKSDGGERKGTQKLKRLISERGAIRQMIRAFVSRQGHLLHALPHLTWLMVQ
jgi:Uncharacterised nucleotidyltransferase